MATVYTRLFFAGRGPAFLLVLIRPGGYREDPELPQLFRSALELVTIAWTDAVHGVRIRSALAVRVLPHRPGRPVGRHHGWALILGQPEPAVGQHRIVAASQQLLQKNSRIQSRKPASHALNTRNECARLIQSHALTRRVPLQVQNQQYLRIRPDLLQKKVGLLHAVGSGAEMVGAPEQTFRPRRLAMLD